MTQSAGSTPRFASLLAFGLTLIVVVPLAAQQTYRIPQDFEYSLLTQMFLDAGYGWEHNSIFHPIDVFSTESVENVNRGSLKWLKTGLPLGDRIRLYSSNDSLHRLAIYGLSGIEFRGQAGTRTEYDHLSFAPFIWGYATWQEHWFARLAFRGTNEEASLPHFSGVPRPIARGGMNTGEIDQSSFGYQNDWALVEYGRGREIWGPFGGENLILSDATPAWERLVLQASYKRLTYRYTFGFLETIDSPDYAGLIQRYLVGRALEYRNGRNLTLGLSEITILAGPSRSIDFAHLNPFGLELEIEQNRRENILGNQTNAVWTADIDWLVLPGVRLTGSYLIDEIKLDKDNDSTYNQTGYSFRAAWSPFNDPVYCTIYGKVVSIGSYTFHHTYPYGNFVNRGHLLSDTIGNDAEKYTFGVRVIPHQSVILTTEYWQARRGENSLYNDLFRPVSKDQSGHFPSGTVSKDKVLRICLNCFPIRFIQLEGTGLVYINSSEVKIPGKWRWTGMVRFVYP